MSNKRPFSEREFQAVEKSRKESLAELIVKSELPYSHIADATGVERRSVKRAAECEGIRYDTAVRLEYYLQWFLMQPRIKRKNLKNTKAMKEEFKQTHGQIVDRYNAKKAIFEAMVAGRRISLLHSGEFRVAEMHTQVCAIRKDIERKQLPYIMRSRWIEIPSTGKNIKEYWLEGRV
jgi:hypothetical protein